MKWREDDLKLEVELTIPRPRQQMINEDELIKCCYNINIFNKGESRVGSL